ncbi:hypothetical protein B566_EDAN012402 [Ephemera danica]|nr:hypothetical protein B566_EDAN012402 [Ephemera danica]
MDGDEAPSFPTIQEEANYWREQAFQYRKGMLDAREELDEFQVQRLKDETRDLKQELKVREHRDTPDSENKRNLELSRTPLDCRRLTKFDTQNNVSQGTPLKLPTPNGTVSSGAMTPSTRISALNIVGDLLRNVSALEGKIAQARAPLNRDATTDSPRYRRGTVNSTSGTPASLTNGNTTITPTTNGKASPNLIRA